MMRHYRLFLALVLASAPGCGGDPDEFGRCDPPLSVTVRTTPYLEFSWTPADCDLYTLTVLQTDLIRWYLSMGDTRNGIRSPIRYGVVPEGAGAPDTAPLSPVPHIVELTRLNQEGFITVVARQQFTPE